MTKLYSPSTAGFYDSGIHLKLPTDAIPLSDDQYTEYLDAITSGAKVLKTDSKNKLSLVDYTAPVVVLTWDQVRYKRDNLLFASDYTQIGDWVGNKDPWIDYRQKLRDVPQDYQDPNDVIWPITPAK